MTNISIHVHVHVHTSIHVQLALFINETSSSCLMVSAIERLIPSYTVFIHFTVVHVYYAVF